MSECIICGDETLSNISSLAFSASNGWSCTHISENGGECDGTCDGECDRPDFPPPGKYDWVNVEVPNCLNRMCYNHANTAVNFILRRKDRNFFYKNDMTEDHIMVYVAYKIKDFAKKIEKGIFVGFCEVPGCPNHMKEIIEHEGDEINVCGRHYKNRKWLYTEEFGVKVETTKAAGIIERLARQALEEIWDS